MAVKAGNSLETVNVLGRIVVPRYVDPTGIFNGLWPMNLPDLNGKHWARVIAVYMKEGLPALMVEAPNGETFEVYLTNVKFDLTATT